MQKSSLSASKIRRRTLTVAIRPALEQGEISGDISGALGKCQFDQNWEEKVAEVIENQAKSNPAAMLPAASRHVGKGYDDIKQSSKERSIFRRKFAEGKDQELSDGGGDARGDDGGGDPGGDDRGGDAGGDDGGGDAGGGDAWIQVVHTPWYLTQS